MKSIFAIFFIVFAAIKVTSAQYVDSLKIALSQSKEDTNKVKICSSIAAYYRWSYPDSSLKYGISGLELARKLNFSEGEFWNLFSSAEALSTKGNYSKALEMSLQLMNIARKTKRSDLEEAATSSIGNVYFYSEDYKSALKYYLLTVNYVDRFKIPFVGFLGETYYNLGQLDSAFFYISKAYELPGRWTVPRYYLGKIYSKRGDFQQALGYLREGIQLASFKLDKVEGFLSLAELFKTMGKTDSAIYYAKNVLQNEFASIPAKQMEAARLLAELFKPTSIDSAFKYQEIMLAANDSLFSKEKVKQMQNLAFNEQFRQQEEEMNRVALNNKLRSLGLMAGVVILLLIAGMLWRSSRIQKRDKRKIEQAYHDLKSTQSQLVHAEKMASLGELTAGIAHEIQNPLNFVNNFSDVNNELIEEVKSQKDKLNTEELDELLRDISQNNGKIIHHGKRADAIVKSMLQHSRSSSGKKEPTDINALADEYLRLAYHGMRAKDKSFNSKLETSLDPTVGKINVEAQEMGRVILNLINNAFYTVAEKKQKMDGGFEPMVTVSTRKSNGKIEIEVKDNGNGIPQKVLDKIFQPFFTTKPTGEGTGLGLSLSYDIITKGHGGELKVHTSEGQGSSFIISLPNYQAS